MNISKDYSQHTYSYVGVPVCYNYLKGKGECYTDNSMCYRYQLQWIKPHLQEHSLNSFDMYVEPQNVNPE